MSLEELKAEGHLRGPLANPDDFCIDWYRLGSDGYAIDYDVRTRKRVRLCRILIDASPDLTIDHLCQNKACIRIDHLELVSLTENFRRGKLFHRSETCRTCGSREFATYRSRQCIKCNRRLAREHLMEIRKDPLKHEEHKIERRRRYHRDKDRINAARRAKRKQAQLLPQ